jgi:hypothetical protein
MQAITGEIEALGAFGGVQRGQDIFDLVHEICADLTSVAVLEEPLQPLVFKAADHPYPL